MDVGKIHLDNDSEVVLEEADEKLLLEVWLIKSLVERRADDPIILLCIFL